MNLRSLCIAFTSLTASMPILAPAAHAQNPVQWSGSVSQSVARASEQSLPLLFWVKDSGDEDDDDLEDAQEDCFRDPVVVGIIQKRFVPVRVGRNSKVIEEARKLGLPTSHGLFCAVLTAEGRLLDQMGPGEVANPAAFALHLNSAFQRYTDELYTRELKPLIQDLEAPKSKVRRAVQTVWRLGISQADEAVIGLLSRKDLQPSEVSRLYQLLAGLGTPRCVALLLERADDKAAAAALSRAEPAALESLLPELPADEGPVTPRQLAAYQAATRICRTSSSKTAEWWATAPGPDRRKELDRLRSKAETVVEYSRDAQRRGR